MKRIFLLALCCSWVSFSGCGEKLPADFPKVFPMTVTITDGTTPLADVRIMFFQISGSGVAYASSGLTDARGIAKISTSQGSFNKAGIPVGEFVVTVEDVIRMNDDISPEEELRMSREELTKLSQEREKRMAEIVRKVPEVLSQATRGSIEDRSPIRFTATEGKNELAINVADYK